MVRLMQQILPMIKLHDEGAFLELKPDVDKSAHMVFSRQYKSIPMKERLKIRRSLRESIEQISNTVIGVVGIEQNREIQALNEVYSAR